MEDSRFEVEPDRFEPDRTRPLGPGQHDRDRFAEIGRCSAAAAKDAVAGRVEDHENAVVPECRTVGIDVRRKLHCLGFDKLKREPGRRLEAAGGGRCGGSWGNSARGGFAIYHAAGQQQEDHAEYEAG